MDAKAKVETFDHGEFGMHLNANGHGDYVRIEDHEAALAEERELRISLESSWQQAEAQVFALIEKHAALLTGLEALAGECESRAESAKDDLNTQAEIAFDYAANQIRALVASAGLEGKVP